MISGAQQAALATALDAELTRVEEDEVAAYDAHSRNNALAGRKLYMAHVGRAGRVLASGDGVEYADLLSSVTGILVVPSVTQEEAKLHGFTGAAGYVGAGVAKDAGALAASVGAGAMGLLKLSPFILVALAVLAVVLFVRRVTPARAGGAA